MTNIFVINQRNGTGVYMWSNGDVYSGDWSRGYIDGKGTFTWSSGSIY
jgi:1-phosphatidylinositol-4-phosphate 5-kinase